MSQPPVEQPLPVQDVNSNRQTLNSAEFTPSQPKLVTSEKSLPTLDLGEPMHVTTDPISIPRRGRTTPCSTPSPGPGTHPGSPCGFGLPIIPSPIITKRTRTASTCERADTSVESGKVKYFSRTKGHGFIVSDRGGDEIFVHISDIEGEYVPRENDEVTFRLCPIPPKLEKYQAIHVRIVHFTPDVHLKWDAPIEEAEKTDDDLRHNHEEV